jgi:outer membrane murein-binding lipoprotein Lpp
MKTLPFVVAIALVSGSMSTAQAGGVEDAKAAQVANCTFLTDVSAPTTTGKHTREALGAAMERARDDAAKAGATHIVWNKIVGSDVSSVSGKAYRCPK